MMELDPITVAALEVLNLKTDKLPPSRQRLADLVADRNPPETWTAHKTAAYRHLCGLVPLRRPWVEPQKLKIRTTAPKPIQVAVQSAA